MIERDFDWSRQKQYPTPTYLSRAIIYLAVSMIIAGITCVPAAILVSSIPGISPVSGWIGLFSAFIPALAVLIFLLRPALKRAHNDGWSYKLGQSAEYASKNLRSTLSKRSMVLREGIGMIGGFWAMLAFLASLFNFISLFLIPFSTMICLYTFGMYYIHQEAILAGRDWLVENGHQVTAE